MSSRYEYDSAKKADFYRHPWNYAIEPFCIFGNLWFVGNRDGASYLVDTGDGLALFDTNFPTAAALLLHDIWAAGFDPRDIRWIIHTHGHYDHFGATGLLQNLSGAVTLLGEKDAEMFRTQPELALLAHAHAEQELFVPDLEVKDGDLFRFGAMRLRCVETPGHTPGAMTFFFSVTDGGRELTACLHGGTGLVTLCRPFIEAHGCAAMRPAFLASIEKLKQEKADIFLGNHTRFNDTEGKLARRKAEPDGPNPFIDPNELQNFLIRLRADYDAMLAYEAEQKE